MMLLKRCVHGLTKAAAPILLIALTACAETPRTATNFCRVLADRIDEMTEPPTDNASVNRLIDHYSRLAEVAPIEVEDSIVTLRDLFIAASKVNVNDPESVQAVADLAPGEEAAGLAAPPGSRMHLVDRDRPVARGALRLRRRLREGRRDHRGEIGRAHV